MAGLLVPIATASAHMSIVAAASTGPVGLTAEYFQAKDLTQHRVTRIDPILDGAGAPPAEITTASGFSARWSGMYTSTTMARTFLCATEAGGSAAKVSTYVDGTLVNYEDTADQGNSWGMSIRLDPSVPHKLVITAIYDSYDGNGMVELESPSGTVGSAEVVPAIVPKVPELIPVSTGSGKIALYGELSAGSTGVNFYRGAARESEDLATPINGGSPVSTPSFTGSSYVLYMDQVGLTGGAQYYHVAKSSYLNPVTGLTTLSSPNPGGRRSSRSERSALGHEERKPQS